MAVGTREHCTLAHAARSGHHADTTHRYRSAGLRIAVARIASPKSATIEWNSSTQARTTPAAIVAAPVSKE